MTRLACLLAMTALLILPAAASAAPGDLDATYGDGGTVTVTGAPADGLAVAADGGAVTAGAGSVTPYPYTAHHRLAVDGRPATGYESGPVQTVFGYYQYSTVGDVAVQADGRIVVGGGVRHPDWGAYPADYLLQYLPDGRPDPSFGSGGKVILDVSDNVHRIEDLAVDAGGHVVFLDSRHVVGRVLPDGRLDPAFGAGGWVDLRALASDYELGFYEFALLPGGSLVAVGHRRGTPAVIRLDAAGRLVQSFGTGGIVLLTADGEAIGGAGAIALGPDGTFVVAGGSSRWPETTARFWAIRLTADGRVDPSFGGPLGTSFIVPPGSTETGVARDAVVQADGKVVLAGEFLEQGEGRKYEHGAVVRLLRDGRPDPSFGGGDGITVVLDRYAGFTEVALQPDGDILLAKDFHLSVTRLDGDVGPYDPAGTGAAPGRARARRRALIADRRGRVKIAVRCPAKRRCRGVVRVRVRGKVVAKRRFSLPAGTRRLSVRIPERVLRGGAKPARIEVRIGNRRVVQRVLLSQRAT